MRIEKAKQPYSKPCHFPLSVNLPILLSRGFGKQHPEYRRSSKILTKAIHFKNRVNFTLR